jgi:hypothetical protein
MPTIAKGKPHSVDGIVLPKISHVFPGPPEAAYNPATVIIVPEIMKPTNVKYLLRVFATPFSASLESLFAPVNHKRVRVACISTCLGWLVGLKFNPTHKKKGKETT